MAPVNNRPFLEYIFDYLENQKVSHIVLSVGYKHEVIQDYFSHKYKSISIEYSIEEEPLGTGGGIKKAFSMVNGKEVIILNGDTIFNIDLLKLYQIHHSKQSEFTIALRQVNDIKRYGSVEVDTDHRITKFNEKGFKTGNGQINGGIYIIKKDFFKNHYFPEKFSLEKDCLEKKVKELPFYGLLCKDYFIDIGIPEDYEKVKNDFKRFKY